jgi:hypothetical protein
MNRMEESVFSEGRKGISCLLSSPLIPAVAEETKICQFFTEQVITNKKEGYLATQSPKAVFHSLIK